MVKNDIETLDQLEFHDPVPNSITLRTGPEEMIRIARGGFYVRGQRVPADGKEALTVYNAFKEWLVWSQLTRS